MQQKPVIFLAFANDRQDNARYLRNLPLELNGIRKALQEAEKQGLCEVVERANVTVEIIFDVFQDSRYRDRIAIFHYGGHADGYQLLLESYQTLLVAGNANGSGQGLAGSATANTLAHAAGLVSFFAKQRGLALVFFNGCTTHQQAEELAKAGIPAVIGTVSEIDDHIATNLAIRFYRGIGQAMTLQRAWDEAIDELKTKNGPENPRGLDRTDPSSENNDRFPWEVYKKEGNLLEWKLEKFGNQNFNLELGTGNKNDENMNQNMVDFEKIAKWLEFEEYSNIFEELDKIYEKISEKTTFNQLRKEHEKNKKSLDYDDRMKTFVNTLKKRWA